MRKRGLRDLYFGRAGEMAVMSELLVRGWNVAVPEVDIGTDVFVVRDDNAILRQVQVKSATARPLKSGFTIQIGVKLARLSSRIVPNDLVFIFPIRNNINGKWADFVIIRRQILHSYYDLDGIGTLTGKDRDEVHFTFSGKQIGSLCLGGKDVSKCLNDWNTDFPVVPH